MPGPSFEKNMDLACPHLCAEEQPHFVRKYMWLLSIASRIQHANDLFQDAPLEAVDVPLSRQWCSAYLWHPAMESSACAFLVQELEALVWYWKGEQADIGGYLFDTHLFNSFFVNSYLLDKTQMMNMVNLTLTMITIIILLAFTSSAHLFVWLASW